MPFFGFVDALLNKQTTPPTSTQKTCWLKKNEKEFAFFYKAAKTFPSVFVQDNIWDMTFSKAN